MKACAVGKRRHARFDQSFNVRLGLCSFFGSLQRTGKSKIAPERRKNVRVGKKLKSNFYFSKTTQKIVAYSSEREREGENSCRLTKTP